MAHIFLPITNTIITKIIAIIPAIIGAKTVNTVRIPAPAVSPVATTEFPKPPVVAVDAALVPANPELIAAAVPPPAIKAKDHCGNAPKIEFIKKITLAFAKGDSDFFTERVTDKIIWDIVGDKRIEGIDNFLAELESRGPVVPLELNFERILTHRKDGAANGIIKLPDGSAYSFSDFYEFRGTKIRKITSSIIKVA